MLTECPWDSGRRQKVCWGSVSRFKKEETKEFRHNRYVIYWQIWEGNNTSTLNPVFHPLNHTCLSLTTHQWIHGLWKVKICYSRKSIANWKATYWLRATIKAVPEEDYYNFHTQDSPELLKICHAKYLKYLPSKSGSHSVVSNSLRLQGLYPARLLCPCDLPGNNTTWWVAMPSSRGTCPIRGSHLCLYVSCSGRQVPYHRTTWARVTLSLALLNSDMTGLPAYSDYHMQPCSDQEKKNSLMTQLNLYSTIQCESNT